MEGQKSVGRERRESIKLLATIILSLMLVISFYGQVDKSLKNSLTPALWFALPLILGTISLFCLYLSYSDLDKSKLGEIFLYLSYIISFFFFLSLIFLFTGGISGVISEFSKVIPTRSSLLIFFIGDVFVLFLVLKNIKDIQ